VNVEFMCKAKAELSLCKYHAMKTYGRVEVKLHASFTSALNGNKWYLHAPALYFRGKSLRYSLNRKPVVSNVGLQVVNETDGETDGWIDR
jgi:hypothetical protein